MCCMTHIKWQKEERQNCNVSDGVEQRVPHRQPATPTLSSRTPTILPGRRPYLNGGISCSFSVIVWRMRIFLFINLFNQCPHKNLEVKCFEEEMKRTFGEGERNIYTNKRLHWGPSWIPCQSHEDSFSSSCLVYSSELPEIGKTDT